MDITQTTKLPTITDTKTIRAICKRAGLRLNKDLGQNYLCNSTVAERIVLAGEVGPDDIVVEPGAGIGALTFHIAAVAKKIFAIELDPRAAKVLRELVIGLGYTNIEVVEHDILEFRPEEHGLKDRQYKVVGSLPYDLAKKIIRKFIEQEPQKPSIVSVLIQREVAKEYVANPPAGSFLARYAEIYSEPKYVQTVTKHAFFPIPPVDGGIIQFKLLNKPIVAEGQVETYRTFIKLCFSAMRKTLLNTLIGYTVAASGEGTSTATKSKQIHRKLTREDLTKIFVQLELSLSARPQELSTDQFTSIFSCINAR